ncbi:galanin peptides preproprotein, partial [Daubentonia madagascariensis]
GPGRRPPARLPPPRRRPFGRSGARVTDAIDNHRSFNDKHGLTGKRELQPEDEVKPEAGTLDGLPDLPSAVSVSSEDTEQP